MLIYTAMKSFKLFSIYSKLWKNYLFSKLQSHRPVQWCQILYKPWKWKTFVDLLYDCRCWNCERNSNCGNLWIDWIFRRKSWTIFGIFLSLNFKKLFKFPEWQIKSTKSCMLKWNEYLLKQLMLLFGKMNKRTCTYIREIRGCSFFNASVVYKVYNEKKYFVKAKLNPWPF